MPPSHTARAPSRAPSRAHPTIPTCRISLWLDFLHATLVFAKEQRFSAAKVPTHHSPDAKSRRKTTNPPSLKALASFDLIQSLASHAVNALVANEGVVADGLNTRSSAPWYLNAPCAAIGELPASCLSFFSSAVLESTKAMAPSERFSLASTHASR